MGHWPPTAVAEGQLEPAAQAVQLVLAGALAKEPGAQGTGAAAGSKQLAPTGQGAQAVALPSA